MKPSFTGLSRSDGSNIIGGKSSGVTVKKTPTLREPTKESFLDGKGKHVVMGAPLLYKT